MVKTLLNASLSKGQLGLLMSEVPVEKAPWGLVFVCNKDHFTGHKCYVWLVTANEQPELMLNAEIFRQEDDDNQKLVEAMRLGGEL